MCQGLPTWGICSMVPRRLARISAHGVIHLIILQSMGVLYIPEMMVSFMIQDVLGHTPQNLMTKDLFVDRPVNGAQMYPQNARHSLDLIHCRHSYSVPCPRMST